MTIRIHVNMKRSKGGVSVRGRFLGMAGLVVVQFIVGIIHVLFGFALLSGSFLVASYSVMPTVYTFYTLVYGWLTLFFTYLIWVGKRSGWIGTVAVSFFVIFADLLAVLDLFSVLGIPKIAGILEVPFYALVLAYIFQSHVRSKYNI